MRITFGSTRLFKLTSGLTTNLLSFTGTAYRNVARSYAEFQQLADALAHSGPQTLVPALPLAQTSAPTDEEGDRLVKIMLQRWLAHVCEDAVLLRDEDLRVSPRATSATNRRYRKAGSGFAPIPRGVLDEGEGLQRARFELTKLET
ncbi:hypothetical protein HWV62_10405 [Athelia sp. TMB]|nr:hypothetical protein HWV62_10405 [Athelia sp. TMB]